MTHYRVTWSGVVRRKFDVERPGDCLYVLWVRFREELAPGLVAVDAAGEVTFPVSLESEVRAADMHQAARAFRVRHGAFDGDIQGGDVVVEEVRP